MRRLPAVRNPTAGGGTFDWLVLFDDRCSDDFREQVEEISEGAFTPIWSSEPFGRDSFASHVADRADASHLITTQIDSDDAMAVDFKARVQAEFAGQKRMFVNFPRGAQIDRTGAVYRSNIVSSPFPSLIERREEDRPPETVFVAKRTRARGHASMRQVDAPVMWAQVVHGTNVSNIVNGRQADPALAWERDSGEPFAERLDTATKDCGGGCATACSRPRRRRTASDGDSCESWPMSSSRSWRATG